MTMMFYRRSIFIITLVGIFSSKTAFASCKGGIAQDDPTFKYTSKAGVKRSCKNISGNPKRKKIMCRLPEVQSHCMLTCGGSCCVDDAEFEFHMNWRSRWRKCGYIANNIKQLWKRRQTYCEDNGSSYNAKIRKNCPYACNLKCNVTNKPVMVRSVLFVDGSNVGNVVFSAPKIFA